MTMLMLSWCDNPSIITLHKIRLFCHIGLAFFSIFLLSSTSVVLAYSIKMYHGIYLHSIPELLTASAVSFLLVGLAWIPSNEYPGSYGLESFRAVWQELLWNCGLTLGMIISLLSLHQSTPGLMTTCGRYFICRAYIFVFVTTWFTSALIAIPTVLLLSSVIYTVKRSPLGSTVLKADIDRFEYFWPGQTHVSSKKRRSTYVGDLPRIEPDLRPGHDDGSLFESEKRQTGYGFQNL